MHYTYEEIQEIRRAAAFGGMILATFFYGGLVLIFN